MLLPIRVAGGDKSRFFQPSYINSTLLMLPMITSVVFTIAITGVVWGYPNDTLSRMFGHDGSNIRQHQPGEVYIYEYDGLNWVDRGSSPVVTEWRNDSFFLSPYVPSIDECAVCGSPNGVVPAVPLNDYSCWDLNMNHVCDISTEDINIDTQCTALDCGVSSAPDDINMRHFRPLNAGSPWGERQSGDAGLYGAPTLLMIMAIVTALLVCPRGLTQIQISDEDTPARSDADDASDVGNERGARCVVCLCNVPKVVFVDCGHICCCIECSRTIRCNTDRRCPMCRKTIVSEPVRIYES